MSDTTTAIAPSVPPEPVQENLPAYLERDPLTKRLRLRLSPTAGQDFKICPFKYQLYHGLRLERAEARTAASYGSAIHEPLHYRYGNKEWTQDRQFEIIHDYFAKNPQPENEWRTEARAQQSITAYNEAYPTDDWLVLKTELLEVISLGVIENDPIIGEPVEILLRYKKDLVVEWHRAIWVVDHKTTSDWNDDIAKNQRIIADRRSFQFRAYAWTERQNHRQNNNNGLPVKGVIGNYIVGRKPLSENPSAVARRTGQEKPRDQFHQEPFPFDDDQLDEWYQEAMCVARRIVRAWKEQYWEMGFDTACSHYGQCQFYNYCETTPQDRQLELGSSRYRTRTPSQEVAAVEESDTDK